MPTDWRDHETRDVPFNGLLASGSGVDASGGYSVPGGPWNVAGYRSTAIRVDGNGTPATVEVTWVGDAGGPSIPSRESKTATADPATLLFLNQGHTITAITITAAAGSSFEVLESNQLPLPPKTAGGAAVARLYAHTDAPAFTTTGGVDVATWTHVSTSDPTVFDLDPADHQRILLNTGGWFLVQASLSFVLQPTTLTADIIFGSSISGAFGLSLYSGTFDRINKPAGLANYRVSELRGSRLANVEEGNALLPGHWAVYLQNADAGFGVSSVQLWLTRLADGIHTT